ncbi:MAG: RsmB/NOP family class I SAM-dependent RNA methyltransferase [Coprobacillaceae bacterium]
MDSLFLDRMSILLKNEYNDFIKSLEKPSIKGFYTNPLKKNVVSYLDTTHINPHPYIKNGYYFDYEQYPLGKHPYFNCGLYYIQEPSAMVVGNLLDVKHDDYILDMCAAPGGKTCQVASKLSKDGLMITNDIHNLRAAILSENVERFGLENTIVTNCDPVILPETFQNFFDKIILDAPCSGEGMFRKLAKAIDDWSLDKVKECAYLQRKLLDSAHQMLKPDGVLVYSTCTYSKEENEDNVLYCMEELGMELLPIQKEAGMSPGINMPEVIRLYPHKNSGEGQFIALLKKKEEGKTKKVTFLKSNITNEQRNLVSIFYKDNLCIPVPKYLYSSNNHIYSIQPQFPMMNKVRILRNGLYLGECKKGRFEPSLSLALTLQKEDVLRYYSFDAEAFEISSYLHGETLIGGKGKGYGVIFVDEFPLSFYKESNNQVKNLYPKGLRR